MAGFVGAGDAGFNFLGAIVHGALHLFERGDGVARDDNLHAYLLAERLVVRELIEAEEVFVPLVYADVQVVDPLGDLLHRALVEEVAAGGEEEVEWFGGCVFEDVAEVFADELVAAFEAEDDDAGGGEVV